MMIGHYFTYIECLERKPVFAEQNLFNAKRFYHEAYKEIEHLINDKTLKDMYTMQYAGHSQQLIGIIPQISFNEFFDKVKNDKYDGEKTCRPPRIKDEEIERAFIIVENRLLKKKPEFINDYERDMLPLIGNTEILDERLGIMTEQLNDLISQIERLIQDNAHHAQNQEEYSEKFQALNDDIEKKKAGIPHRLHEGSAGVLQELHPRSQRGVRAVSG